MVQHVIEYLSGNRNLKSLHAVGVLRGEIYQNISVTFIREALIFLGYILDESTRCTKPG